MRILDRYVARQLVPVWIWCLVVFIFLTCLIDLFGRLDDILHYHVRTRVIVEYYLNFIPFIFVRACPLALLFSAAFVTTRLSRYQEFLAMSASGTSLVRASVPFVFVGWLASVLVFGVNEYIVPRTSVVSERIRQEAFTRKHAAQTVENAAIMDTFNRLYHAREVDVKAGELHDVTILEQDWHNRPTKSLYAQRAVYTPHGWLLLYGTIYRVGADGALRGLPERFVERLISYPVTPRSFAEPESRPDTMRYGQLRLMIVRLKQTGMKDVRRYAVELGSKLTLPLLNLIVALIGFAGSMQTQLRGNLKGLGVSLGLGIAYYVGVAICQALTKGFPIPILLGLWLPHIGVAWWCFRQLSTTR